MRSLPSQSEPLLQPDGKARIPWYGWFDELWRKLRGLWSVDDGKILFMDGTTIGGATVGSGLTLNRTTNTLTADAGAGFPEAPQDGTVYGRKNAAWSPAGGQPAAPNMSVQFNNSGNFGGEANLTWNLSTDTLTVDGDVSLTAGSRITGSWVAPTLGSAYLQNSDTAADYTYVSILPRADGALVSSFLTLFSNTDTSQSTYNQLSASEDYVQHVWGRTGTATSPDYLLYAHTDDGSLVYWYMAHYPGGQVSIFAPTTLVPTATPPSYMFNVDGSFNLTGTLNLNGSSGTSGWVLTSQGASDPIWAPSTSGVSDGDKGDITVSNTGSTWTIDNGAVTYAKIQDVSSAYRLLGRGSDGGTGDVEEISIGSGLLMSGTTLSTSFGQLLVDDTSGGAILFDDSGDVIYEG